MKKPPIYYLGTSLIIISLMIFAYIFYPLVRAYYFPPSLTDFKRAEYTLIIPKIHAIGRVIEDVDPWNESVYRDLLKIGIGQAKGFAHPDESGPVFIFAHSSGTPWEITHYNTVFLRLAELKKNDDVQIWYKGKEYHYTVMRTQEVYPTEVNVVRDEKEADLILQTCTPLGTDWKRLLVFAKKIKAKE